MLAVITAYHSVFLCKPLCCTCSNSKAFDHVLGLCFAVERTDIGRHKVKKEDFCSNYSDFERPVDRWGCWEHEPSMRFTLPRPKSLGLEDEFF